MSEDRTLFLKGMYDARRTLLRARIDLAALELLTPEDGLKVLSLLQPEDICGRMPWLRDDGRPGAQLEVEGVLVRWPQRSIALPGGGWRNEP